MVATSRIEHRNATSWEDFRNVVQARTEQKAHSDSVNLGVGEANFQ
jgi:hypothetical protein